jgi:hypothetical protein
MVGLAFGIAILVAVLFQIITGYALKLRSHEVGEIVDREKQPGLFWYRVAIEAALGLFIVALALGLVA